MGGTNLDFHPESVICVERQRGSKYRGQRKLWFDMLAECDGKTVQDFLELTRNMKDSTRGWLRFFVDDRVVTFSNEPLLREMPQGGMQAYINRRLQPASDGKRQDADESAHAPKAKEDGERRNRHESYREAAFEPVAKALLELEKSIDRKLIKIDVFPCQAKLRLKTGPRPDCPTIISIDVWGKVVNGELATESIGDCSFALHTKWYTESYDDEAEAPGVLSGEVKAHLERIDYKSAESVIFGLSEAIAAELARKGIARI